MSLLEHTPGFGDGEVIRFAQDVYGMEATAAPMPSERDQNFLLETVAGERFVLKIANALEDRLFLEAQNQAMAHLIENGVVGPRVVPGGDDDLIADIRSPAGRAHFVRLVTYLPGIPYGELKWHSDALLLDLGAHLGCMDRVLADFYHPAARRDFYWDLAQAQGVVGEYKPLLTDPGLSALVEAFAADYERHVVPLLPGLRKSVIHNDANDYNVIVDGGDHVTRGQRIAGIIDFGDLVYSHTVNNLASALAYAVLDRPDPLGTAALVVQGYHQEYPLEEAEIAALYGLLCMRLCVSACIAAHQSAQRADNEYLAISQGPIRRTLPRLAQIHPRFAEAAFREACGLPPVPQTERIISWLRGNAHALAPVLGADFSAAPGVVFDLSVGSTLVDGDPQANVEPALTRRLFAEMEAAGAQVGVGRYAEARILYTGPQYSTGDMLIGGPRTVHIGMDLFAKAGAPVYAPLAATLHAFSNNAAPQDYGPVIILRHQTSEGEAFYTLYGHLSAASLEGLHPGQAYTPGQQIGTIGSPEANGGWTPHLHFQIITDLLDLDTDFPGVCRASQSAVWTSFSPDPNLILRVPAERFPPREPGKVQTLAARRKYIGRNLSLGYDDPVKIERGWMQYMYDETGRRYLDAYNNVPHVGHCHPRVVAAGQRQMRVLNTNTRYLHDTINHYAERLCATLPEPLRVCFFLNSASEANELALRLARAYTGQRDMIVLAAAYHGHTTSLIDISPYKHEGPGGAGAPPWVHTAPIPDVYRGLYKAGDPGAGEKYAGHVLEVVETLHRDGRGLAGFIAETCPSVGGQIIPPDGYLAQAYRHVREAGGLCIADEVQTGYGRTGTHFYAFEAQGVVPDIVVLGKPIGNGHPIAALITSPEIAASFDNGMEFFSTFGGNTVSCAIGLAVLNVVLEENLQTHALRVGDHLLAGLGDFKARYSVVGDVRGSGLFLGMELVRDRQTLEPAGAEAAFIANRMRAYGVLLGTDGHDHNVIKIRPPMPFSDGDADTLIAAMDKVLAENF